MGDKDRPARVGVRELRQNLSIYLDRVKHGETLEVTEHGQPVARVEPLPTDQSSPFDRMLAQGRVLPARADLLDFRPLQLAPGPSLSSIIHWMRDEERW